VKWHNLEEQFSVAKAYFAREIVLGSQNEDFHIPAPRHTTDIFVHHFTNESTDVNLGVFPIQDETAGFVLAGAGIIGECFQEYFLDFLFAQLEMNKVPLFSGRAKHAVYAKLGKDFPQGPGQIFSGMVEYLLGQHIPGLIDSIVNNWDYFFEGLCINGRCDEGTLRVLHPSAFLLLKEEPKWFPNRWYFDEAMRVNAYDAENKTTREARMLNSFYHVVGQWSTVHGANYEVCFCSPVEEPLHLWRPGYDQCRSKAHTHGKPELLSIAQRWEPESVAEPYYDDNDGFLRFKKDGRLPPQLPLNPNGTVTHPRSDEFFSGGNGNGPRGPTLGPQDQGPGPSGPSVLRQSMDTLSISPAPSLRNWGDYDDDEETKVDSQSGEIITQAPNALETLPRRRSHKLSHSERRRRQHRAANIQQAGYSQIAVPSATQARLAAAQIALQDENLKSKEHYGQGKEKELDPPLLVDSESVSDPSNELDAQARVIAAQKNLQKNRYTYQVPQGAVDFDSIGQFSDPNPRSIYRDWINAGMCGLIALRESAVYQGLSKITEILDPARDPSEISEELHLPKIPAGAKLSDTYLGLFSLRLGCDLVIHMDLTPQQQTNKTWTVDKFIQKGFKTRPQLVIFYSNNHWVALNYIDGGYYNTKPRELASIILNPKMRFVPDYWVPQQAITSSSSEGNSSDWDSTRGWFGLDSNGNATGHEFPYTSSCPYDQIKKFVRCRPIPQTQGSKINTLYALSLSLFAYNLPDLAQDLVSNGLREISEYCGGLPSDVSSIGCHAAAAWLNRHGYTLGLISEGCVTTWRSGELTDNSSIIFIYKPQEGQSGWCIPNVPSEKLCGVNVFLDWCSKSQIPPEHPGAEPTPTPLPPSAPEGPGDNSPIPRPGNPQEDHTCYGPSCNAVEDNTVLIAAGASVGCMIVVVGGVYYYIGSIASFLIIHYPEAFATWFAAHLISKKTWSVIKRKVGRKYAFEAPAVVHWLNEQHRTITSPPPTNIEMRKLVENMRSFDAYLDAPENGRDTGRYTPSPDIQENIGWDWSHYGTFGSGSSVDWFNSSPEILSRVDDLFPRGEDKRIKKSLTPLSGLLKDMRRGDLGHISQTDKRHFNNFLNSNYGAKNSWVVCVILHWLCGNLSERVKDLLASHGYWTTSYEQWNGKWKAFHDNVRCIWGGVRGLEPGTEYQIVPHLNLEEFSKICYLQTFVGRPHSDCDWDDEEEKRKRDIPLFTLNSHMPGKRKVLDQQSFRLAVRKMLKKNLHFRKSDIHPPTLAEFYAKRYQWLVKGHCGGEKAIWEGTDYKDVRDKLEQILGHRLGVRKSDVAEHFTIDDLEAVLRCHPFHIAKAHTKGNEHGKIRAIYGSSYSHYVLGAYLSHFFEEPCVIEGTSLGLTAAEEADDMAKMAQLCADGKYTSCIDYTDFNAQHTLWQQKIVMEEIVNVGKELYPTILPPEVTADINRVGNWYARSFENQYFVRPDTQAVVKTESGLFSGVRVTTLVNTVINKTYHDMIVDDLEITSKIRAQPCFSRFLGDDSKLFYHNALARDLVLEAFLTSNLALNPAKQLAAQGRGEYLRLLYSEEGKVQGCSARSLATLVHGNVESDTPSIGSLRCKEIHEGFMTLARRGYDRNRLQLWAVRLGLQLVWGRSKSTLKEGIRYLYLPISSCGLACTPISLQTLTHLLVGHGDIQLRKSTYQVPSPFRNSPTPELILPEPAGELGGLLEHDVVIPEQVEGMVNRIEGILRNKKNHFNPDEFQSSKDMVDNLVDDWKLTLGKGQRYKRCITRLVAADISSGPVSHGEQLYFDAHQFKLNQAFWVGGRRRKMVLRHHGEVSLDFLPFALFSKASLAIDRCTSDVIGINMSPGLVNSLRVKHALRLLSSKAFMLSHDNASHAKVEHDWDKMESRVRGIIGILQSLWSILTKEEQSKVVERASVELDLSKRDVLRLIQGKNTLDHSQLGGNGYDFSANQFAIHAMIKQSPPQVQAICSILLDNADGQVLSSVVELSKVLCY
jgi:hypothetical protein